MVYQNYRNQNYKRDYRVKSMVRSFRDLEVYQKTIQLSHEILSLDFLNQPKFKEEKEKIKIITETIPELIADSYGTKFDDKELAHKKLTESISLVTNTITKLDLLKQNFLENQEIKEQLDKLVSNYQRQKIKILNLRKAWDKLAEYDKNKIN